MAIESPPPAALNDPRLALIARTHLMLTGVPLVEPFDALSLWHADRVVVAHGTEADPVFFYGNRAALALFEMSFSEFASLPSRFSAEPLARAARERLLERVTRNGYVDDYSGVRISKSGARFTIENATVWNLVDEAGIYRGQAAAFAVPRIIRIC